MTAQIVVPELGESVKDARVARWLKHEGDEVAVGEAVVELETEKTDLEVGATDSGVIARIAHGEGDDVRIGDVLATIEPKKSEAKKTEPTDDPRAAGASGETAAQQTRDDHATPSERRRARGQEEHALASGSTIRAVAPMAAPQPEPRAARAPRDTPAPLAPEAASSADRARPEERVRLSKRRLTIAARLVEVQRTAAMLTTFNEVDMSEVSALRAGQREAFRERHGVGLGIVSFFVKASVVALGEFPWVNAEIQGEEAVLKRYYDIGIAVGATEGLVVPVLRDADRRSFAEIERAIKDMAARAESHRLTLEELRGGTFTITNGGVFGSLLSTPILNPPQVAILGLHRIEDRVRAVEGAVVVRPMMYLALTYDHRLIDGRDAVQFLDRIRQLVEDPRRLVLEV